MMSRKRPHPIPSRAWYGANMCLPLVPASSTLNVPSRFSSLTRLSTAMRFPKPRLRAASGSVTGLFTGGTGSAMRRNPQRTCRELLLANCNLYATNRASDKVVDRGADEAADVADHSIDDRDEDDSEPASCTAEWSGHRNHRSKEIHEDADDDSDKKVRDANYQRELARLNPRDAPNARHGISSVCGGGDCTYA